jgi:hypothetical protein
LIFDAVLSASANHNNRTEKNHISDRVSRAGAEESESSLSLQAGNQLQSGPSLRTLASTKVEEENSCSAHRQGTFKLGKIASAESYRSPISRTEATKSINNACVVCEINCSDKSRSHVDWL